MLSATQRRRLSEAHWLASEPIRRVFAALAAAGAESRAVGGAVRNTLLGQPIDDVDIATTATPDAVIAAAGRAGLAAIPTGLAHGTVTVLAQGSSYEVTTLRRDLATDGRHATVAFTGDWAADASRRDFTINALYVDPDGTLFDPLGGAADLSPTRIRFIGDPRRRIREDYLRILRFFRFSARYVDGPLDAGGVAACDLERAGLARVSTERVRVELLKLLACPRAVDVCRIMQAHGFLVAMLGAAPFPGRLERMAAIEAGVAAAPDPLLRLAALAVPAEGDAGAIARRLKLSGAERTRLAAIAAHSAAVAAHASVRDDRRALYRLGPDRFRDVLLAAWAASPAAPHDSGWLQRLARAASWATPRLPVGGAEAIALGIQPGPAVGRLIAAVEAWWISHDFDPDRSQCLAEMQRLVSAGWPGA